MKRLYMIYSNYCHFCILACQGGIIVSSNLKGRSISSSCGHIIFKHFLNQQRYLKFSFDVPLRILNCLRVNISAEVFQNIYYFYLHIPFSHSSLLVYD